MWLANCCFAHISLGFPFPLRSFDEQSGYSFYPFPCHPGPLARSWRCPFHSCGVPYPETPTLDRGSLTATIAEFMHVGPHSRRLDGTLGTSHSSAPFRNRSEAFHTAGLHKALSKQKYRVLFSPNRRRKPGPKGPSVDCDLKAVRNDCLTRRKSIRPCVLHVAYEVGAARQQTVRSPRTMYPHSQEWHRNREATVYLPA